MRGPPTGVQDEVAAYANGTWGIAYPTRKKKF